MFPDKKMAALCSWGEQEPAMGGEVRSGDVGRFDGPKVDVNCEVVE